MSTLFQPFGSQFVVNPTTQGLQLDADLTAFGAGGFISVWTHQSGATTEIRGQMFDAFGMPNGAELQLTTNLGGHQSRADVIALPDGGFTLSFTSTHGGSALGIFGQNFDAGGAPIGDAFAINGAPEKTHFESSGVLLSDGTQVFAYTALGRDGSNMGVFAQRFDANGTKIGAEFQVNEKIANVQSDPTVIALDSGGFAVVYRTKSLDRSDYGIATRWFDQDGVETVSESVVNATTLGAQTQPDAAQLTSGEVVYVWQSAEQDGSGTGIYARVLSEDGTTWNAEVLVNSTTQGDQISPFVLPLPDGGYAIIWQGADLTILAQRFDTGHTPVGAETAVNSEVSGVLQNPQGTVLPNGDMVISWGTTNDGAGNGIEAQLFQGAYIGTAQADRLDDMAQTNRMFGEDGADILRGLDGADFIEGQGGQDILIGNEGRDQLFGGLGDDVLRGGAGNDRLNGGAKNDVLIGGNGWDRFTGGSGDDLLEGGHGRDRFVFSTGGGTDEVVDFQLNWDRVLLDQSLWQGSLSVAEVLDAFGQVQNGAAYLTFAGQEQLILSGVTDLEALGQTIDLI